MEGNSVKLALRRFRIRMVNILFSMIYFGDWRAQCGLDNGVPFMSEVIDQAQHEFWRPPMQVASDAVASHDLCETCPRCGTEFIVGARFCHTCGGHRPGLRNESVVSQVPGFAEFISAGERLGLTTASFIAFVIGVFCLVGAIAVGVIFGAKTLVDWQAIQLWRIEWLLGAIAAYVAGV